LAPSSKPRPFPSREAILEFIQDSPGPVSRREIARAFKLDADQRPELRQLLKEFAEDGVIDKGRGKTVNTQGGLPAVAVLEVTGTDGDGDVLARPLNWAEDGDPPKIYMKAEKRGRRGGRSADRGAALGPGDRVLARLSRRSPSVYEGQVIRRIGSGPSSVLGLVAIVRGEVRVRPVDKRARHDLFVVPEESIKADPGDLVRAEVLRGKRLGLQRARIVERLEGGTKSLSLIALHEHDIPVEFPDAAIAQAEAAGPATLDGRTDLRDIPLVTIDGADARDFDDAVWAEADDDPKNPGGWHLLVAIADVSWYVRPNDALDKEASTRGNSVYFPDRVVPMLPEALSNGWCSLNPKEDRGCLAAHLWIDARGKLLRHTFVRGLMRSAARLTYHQAQNAHDGVLDDTTGPLAETVIAPLFGAYKALSLGRDDRGVLELDLPERRITMGEDGQVAKIAVAPRYDSHRLIEEFMIAANVAAAETLTRKKAPCMFRVHGEPAVDKLESLREVLDGLGLKLARGQAVRPAQFNGILAKVADTPEAPLVNEMILRTQAQAEYSPENIGHFGLALKRYCHFTSPIRRYSDLIVHRALIQTLGLGDGGLGKEPPDLEKLGEHISATERRAAAAERDAVDRLTAQFLAGQEGSVFNGRIAGVNRAGLFVRLEDTGADGLVPARSLPRDTYMHDENRQALRGRRTKREYRLGDQVEVMLAEATPITGGLILHLMEGGGAPAKRRGPKRNRKR